MANIAGSKKRARQNIKRHETNRFHRSTMRSKIKAFKSALTDRNTADEAQALLASAVSSIDACGRKGVIPKNRASRYVSRLTHAFRAFSQQ